MPNFPKTTRLRYVSAPTADKIQGFFDKLGARVQVYGAPIWHPTEKKWYCWFVPDDAGADKKSVSIK